MCVRRRRDGASICRSFGTITQVTVRSDERDPHRAVDQVPDLPGLRGHLHVLVRDVLEQAGQVDLLLVVAAERGRACWPTIATTGWWSSFAS